MRGVVADLDEDVPTVDAHGMPVAGESLGQCRHAIVHLDDQGAGLLRERVERRGAQEPPGVDGDEVVADALDLAEQVAGHDDGDAELVAGAADEVEHLIAAGRVEPVRGLVEEQELRVVDERLGQLDALLHARRVAAHGPVALLEEADVAQHVGGALAGRRARQAGHARHVVDEVGRRDVGGQAVVLGHVADELADGQPLAGDVEVEDARRASGRVEEARGGS